MVVRGVVVSYETIRSWCAKFGPDYANRLRGRRARPGDEWHLDEVFVRINGTTQLPVARGRTARPRLGHLVAVTPQLGGPAAKRFFRKLPKGLQYVPRVIVTDKPASYLRSLTARFCRR